MPRARVGLRPAAECLKSSTKECQPFHQIKVSLGTKLKCFYVNACVKENQRNWEFQFSLQAVVSLASVRCGRVACLSGNGWDRSFGAL